LGAGEEVVRASEYRALQSQVRELNGGRSERGQEHSILLTYSHRRRDILIDLSFRVESQRRRSASSNVIRRATVIAR